MGDSGSQDRYRVRQAQTDAEVVGAQRLRRRAFGLASQGNIDADVFDARCQHFLVEEVSSSEAVATFRVLPLASGADIGSTYSAQFYDLSALAKFGGRMAELGRFCVAPGRSDPEILRLAWGALTAFVDQDGTELLFGCSSFAGTDRGVYSDAFEMLRQDHLAPTDFKPEIKAPNVVRFSSGTRRVPDRQRALKSMPPLLRSYLSMGGWVSDHAVVDHDMNTLHVFTGLEIDRIPPGRARVLRAAAVS